MRLLEDGCKARATYLTILAVLLDVSLGKFGGGEAFGYPARRQADSVSEREGGRESLA